MGKSDGIPVVDGDGEGRVVGSWMMLVPTINVVWLSVAVAGTDAGGGLEVTFGGMVGIGIVATSVLLDSFDVLTGIGEMIVLS